jgi:Signal recognition particle GTPase
MFKILKEKLNIFKKKLSEEVSVEESAGIIGKKINEKRLDEILDEFEISLLEADVAYDVAEEIRSRIRERVLGLKIKIGTDPEKVVEQIIKKHL